MEAISKRTGRIFKGKVATLMIKMGVARSSEDIPEKVIKRSKKKVKK